MKINKSFSCIVLAIVLGVSPAINFTDNNLSYAQTGILNYNNIENEEEERKKEEQRQKERDYYSAIDLIASFPSLYSNSKNKIKISAKNVGGFHFEKSKIQLTSIPAEISLINSASTVQNIGNVYVGNSQEVIYDIEVHKDAKSGNYPITFEFTGNYGTDVNNFKEYKFSKTFYINIIKAEKSDEKTNYKPFLIYSINHPAIINKGELADMEFTIKNPNDVPMNSIKVSVTPDDGIVNQTQNIFVENNFPPLSEKTFNVKLFAQDKAEKKNYSIKITVEPTNPSENISPNTNSDDDTASTVRTLTTSTQYTGIFYNAPKEDESDNDGVKNPYIMISNYNYGEKPVQPNEQFPLTMSFVNTSSEKTIRNIKISLTSDDGTFIAVNSSNSFFINSMEANSSVTKTINFITKPDAPTKTVSMNIDYSYEDTKGNALTAKDSISIPVVQKTLLSIDDVMEPQYVVEGEAVNVSLNFYNLGKTQISNLKMTASGNFSVQGENSYFVGNLDPGKNDSFSVSVIPDDYKKLSGKVDFSYETLEGEIKTEQKTFDFSLNPTPSISYDDMYGEDMYQEKKDNNIYFIILGLALITAIGVILKKKYSKKKKMQELDLDE